MTDWANPAGDPLTDVAAARDMISGDSTRYSPLPLPWPHDEALQTLRDLDGALAAAGRLFGHAVGHAVALDDRGRRRLDFLLNALVDAAERYRFLEDRHRQTHAGLVAVREALEAEVARGRLLDGAEARAVAATDVADRAVYDLVAVEEAVAEAVASSALFSGDTDAWAAKETARLLRVARKRARRRWDRSRHDDVVEGPLE